MKSCESRVEGNILKMGQGGSVALPRVFPFAVFPALVFGADILSRAATCYWRTT